MATNRKDIQLALKVSTEGAEGIGEVAGDLRDLGAEGKRLGTALDGAPVERLTAELEALTSATANARTAEAAARAEHTRSKRTLEDKRDALALTRAQIKAGAGDTDKLRAAEAALNIEIAQATIAQRAKRREMDAAALAAKAAAAEERKLAEQLQAVGKASKSAAADVAAVGKNVAASGALLRQLGPLMAGVFGVQQFTTTIAEAESLNRSFTAIFGSAKRAGEEMAFIQGTANRLGLETQSLARSYQSLAASTKGTTLEGQATRDVFEAIARAMSTLGRSSAETDRALTAVAQMASKGKVSMEELRGQLGEALPGALKAAADGAGITVEQLGQMVETGQVLAQDLLPVLTKGLNNLYANGAPPDSMVSNWNRLKNTVTEVSTALGEGGAAKGLSSAAAGAAIGLQAASAAVDILGTGIGETVAAIVSGNLEFGTADEVARKYEASLRKTAETAGFLTAEQRKLTDAQHAGTEAAKEAFRRSEIQARQNEALGESMLKVRSAYAEMAKGAKESTDLAEKVAKARSTEADTLVRLAALSGSERDQRAAATEAAALQEAASRRLAQSREVEAIIATSLALRLREEALRRNDATEATKKSIEEAERSRAAKNAEAEAAKALATSKAIEAQAARTAAEAYKDNADRVQELRGAAAAAAAEVARLVEMQRRGTASADDVTAAQMRAAGAVRLYADALADATARAERQIAIEQQSQQVMQAGTAVEVERVRAAREVAAARGDVLKMSEMARQESALQVRQAEEEAAGALRLADAIRTAANRREEEARATGTLTAEKLAEIEASRRSAELKELEAQRAGILADKLRDLANSEQARTDALEAQIAMQERAYDIEQRRLALKERKRQVTNTKGEAVSMEVDTPESVRRTLEGYGLSREDAKREAGRFFSGNGSLNFGRGNDLSGTGSLSETLRRIGERASNPAPQVGGTRTVNINLGGRRTAVQVASQEDSNALVGVLRGLEGAAGSTA